VTDFTHDYYNFNAYEAAQEALESKNIVGELALRRYASEAAARATVGVDALDLDLLSREYHLGHRGNNYPTFDLSSSTEVASIKTKWNDDGELDSITRSAYKQDFLGLYGWGRSVHALIEDADNILAVRDTGAPVPSEFKNANQAQAADYLRNSSILRIPDDHVDTVRNDIKEDISLLPENYLLTGSPSHQDIEDIIGRIQPIGITSGELRQLIRNHTQGEYQEEDMQIRDDNDEITEELSESEQDDEPPLGWRPGKDTIESIQNTQDTGLEAHLGDTDIHNIDTNLIVMADTAHVSQKGDFKKVSYEDMEEGLKKLESVVKPGVENGLGGDDFYNLDQRSGLDATHGYKQVYDAFYGDDAITLEQRGDRFHVINGAHRLYVAKQLGINSIPARVLGE